MSKHNRTTSDAMAEYPYLMNYLKDGTCVYVIIRSVARSGMSRVMDFYVTDTDGNILRITPLFEFFGIGTWANKSDGIRVSGRGMDMALHSVYVLGEYIGIDLHHVIL